MFMDLKGTFSVLNGSNKTFDRFVTTKARDFYYNAVYDPFDKLEVLNGTKCGIELNTYFYCPLRKRILRKTYEEEVANSFIEHHFCEIGSLKEILKIVTYI